MIVLQVNAQSLFYNIVPLATFTNRSDQISAKNIQGMANETNGIKANVTNSHKTGLSNNQSKPAANTESEKPPNQSKELYPPLGNSWGM